ncbi:leucine-rich repeat transmembrane neuronal protein 2-like, partial [Contarinia nasturtii]|uniref:leucine-rich repeat transmembrane neuronal protein 2-like n=1 Tax=Contarinia nasturtii TaxID=265458 RepID=UPI0012D43E34
MKEIFSKFGARLETLDASFNFFHDNTLSADIFRKVIKLKHLYLSQASISYVNADTFSKLGELITLDLSHNSIATFDEHLFENNKKMKSLHLENNPLRRVDCNIFIPIMNKAVVNFTWANVDELSTSCFKNSVEFNLDQRDEIIVRVPQKSFEFPIGKEKFQKLTFLNISENQLKNAPKVIDFVGTSIKTLDLSSNFIGPIIAETFERFENLVYLNLSHTNLSNFDFSTFYHQRNLEVLDLSFNRLQKVNFTLLYRNFLCLETLRLEGNELTEINSVNRAIFPKLSALGISRNHFSCDYLATFLPPWQDKVKLIIYPTNKTNIEKVDCRHGQKSNTINIEVTMEINSKLDLTELKTTTGSSTLKTTERDGKVDTKMDNERHVVINVEQSSLSADVRVL